MNITDKIIEQSDKLRFYTTEMLKPASAVAIFGTVLGAATVGGFTAASLITPDIYKAMLGAGAGAIAGFAINNTIVKMSDRIADLVKPITGNANRISNERLYRNFEDLYNKSGFRNAKESALIESIMLSISDDKFESLQDYLGDQRTREAKDMSKQLWKKYDERLLNKMSDIASTAAQTPLGEKIKVASSRLSALLERTGLQDVSATAYASESDALKTKGPADINQTRLAKAFIVDTQYNENLDICLVRDLKNLLPEEAYVSFAESVNVLGHEPKIGSIPDVIEDDRKAPTIGLSPKLI